MVGRLKAVWEGDPRYRQIAALSVLLAIQFASVDFGATPQGTAVALGAALATQALGAHSVGAPFDWRSPAITGLSLSLLLRAPSPGWLALAAMIGVGSKFLLRVDGRHVFNPSGFAIVGAAGERRRRLGFAGAVGRGPAIRGGDGDVGASHSAARRGAPM